jgi:hypothetical protein
MRTLMTGATFSAMISYWGPMQIAWGMISPKKRTAVTEMITAHKEGTRRSRKMGRASMAVAFDINKVTNR